MDIYALNFKRAICILNNKNIRPYIIGFIKEHDIDLNVQYVDSYTQAVVKIRENKFDQYDHLILDLSVKNTKINDFVEFIKEEMKDSPNFIINYSNNNGIEFVDIS